VHHVVYVFLEYISDNLDRHASFLETAITYIKDKLRVYFHADLYRLALDETSAASRARKWK